MGTVHAREQNKFDFEASKVSYDHQKHKSEKDKILPTRPPKDMFKYGLPKQQIDYDDCDDGESREFNLDGMSARVDRVHINGLARTKDDIIQDVVKELFSARDFQEVIVEVHNVKARLDSLGCFRNISVFIDTSKGPQATPDGLEVTYHVKELRRVVGGINTLVGENEGSLVVGLRAPNLFGRGERLQTECCYGSKRSNNYNITFVKPFRGKYKPQFSASAYQSMAEWPSSGYKQLMKGLLFDFGFNSFPYVKHNFQWDCAIRDISVISRSSSFDVREEAGLSLKSALKHILSIDLRDEPIFPSCGSLFQITSELAGIGGDVGYIKNEGFFQMNSTLFNNFVLQTSVTGGVMTELGNNSTVNLSDMYYLGGPLSLRGFQMRGIGPHTEGDSVGSHWFWASGVHLYTPLPFRPGRGGFGELFRTHFFVNCGNADKLVDGDDRPLKDIISENVRIAYGVGIAMRLGQMARVELNYCFPHQFKDGDVTQSGVQFGIGVQFL